MASTIDKKEIQIFNEFAIATQKDEWSKIFGLLFEMNQVRMPFIIKGIKNSGFITTKVASSQKPLTGLRILDVGSGAGYVSEALAKLGAKVTGLDAAQEIINLAQKHLNKDPEIKNRVNYVCETIENFSAKHKEAFDAVIASEIIEHVNNQDLFVKSCVSVVKPGGSVFITTINKTWSSWITSIIFYEYVAGIIPKGTHQWNKFISPQHVTKILNNYNCDTNLVTGCYYNIVTGNWNLRTSDAVYYLLHALKD